VAPSAIPGRGVVVHRDRASLLRVLVNLLDNAIRHAHSRVELRVSHDAGDVVFTVDDDGPGITPLNEISPISRVLDRFDYYGPRMVRPTVHSPDAMLDAARSVVLGGGARAATIDAIVRVSGAPKGSIYHRFGSLDELLAQMWMRAVKRSQGAFIRALDDPDPLSAAVAAALSIHDFAASEPADARLLASLRREDLIQTVHSPDIDNRLRDLNRPLQVAIGHLARRLFGDVTPVQIEATLCAVVDLPLGAVRRHLVGGTAIPPSLRPQLEAAVRSALAHAAKDFNK